MAGRIAKELDEVRRWERARDVRTLDGNVRRWGGLLLPNNPPYNTGAFRFELTFSPNHPFEPPCATLRTPIYHPSVDLEGRVCQPLTTHAEWKPATRAIQGGARGPAAAAGRPRPPAAAAAGRGPGAAGAPRGVPAPGRGTHPAPR
ncbi:ubiquitin/ISG15-conjugating enzyme E2 L6 isoform X2 [Serinus canaria]|uniref:ubiquitin/ISG15-conjugating enzyme E2 L6 isoform X2 n=1 Tax=Serinus canaria TaxID=9135 RepID=UPI0011AE6050|nr:ubiquitin/ISG15-conjugating enzyme E2 L6 isoform X2 [Serinus canaria]